MNITYARLIAALPGGLLVGWSAYQIGYVSVGLAAPPLASHGPVTWLRLILTVVVGTAVALALTWGWGLRRRPQLLPVTAAASGLLTLAIVGSLLLGRLVHDAHDAALILSALGFPVGVGTILPWYAISGDADAHPRTAAVPPAAPYRPQPPPWPAPGAARPGDANRPPQHSQPVTQVPTEAAPPFPPPAKAPAPTRPAPASPPTTPPAPPTAPPAPAPRPGGVEPDAPASAVRSAINPQQMPTTSHPAHDEVTRIAERLARQVAPHLLRRLEQQYGADWVAKVAARRGARQRVGPSALRDYRYCLRLFADDPATAGWISNQCRRDAHKLVQLAHRAAHRRTLTTADVERARKLAEHIGKALPR